jgi:hypothetical protein
MTTHIHHIRFRSRGGSDDASNLRAIDHVEHARLHALDFLSGGAWFDFRQSGARYLDHDLVSQIKERMSYFISQQNTENPPAKGCKHSEESKQKRSEAVRGERNPRFGKPPTQGFTGRSHTEDSRSLTSEKLKGNKNAEGTKWSEEACAQQSSRLKGKSWWFNPLTGRTTKSQQCPGPHWRPGRK